MAKAKYKKDRKAEQVQEPQANYNSEGGSKSVRFFNSFEEMNEADAKEMAKFTPEQHLQHATALIQRIYAEELKKKFSDYKIHFK